MSTTSFSLLARLRRPGDEIAWQRFVSLYTPLLYHWCKSAGLNGGDAEDLVQDIFAALIQKLPEFEYDRKLSFRGWLRTIVVNRCRDRHRRRNHEPHLARDGELDGQLPDDIADLAEEEYRSQLVA